MHALSFQAAPQSFVRFTPAGSAYFSMDNTSLVTALVLLLGRPCCGAARQGIALYTQSDFSSEQAVLMKSPFTPESSCFPHMVLLCLSRTRLKCARNLFAAVLVVITSPKWPCLRATVANQCSTAVTFHVQLELTSSTHFQHTELPCLGTCF